MPEQITTLAILAGGLATRLRPITEKIPKVLVPVAGEPFLAHQLRLVRGYGFQHAVICAGYLAEQIQEFVGDGSRFDMRVEFSLDGDTLLGTAGALKRALPLLGERFLTIYGDSYLPCDYLAAANGFAASGKLGLMSVYRNRGAWDTSNVEYRDGQIVAYDKRHQTPRMEYIDYGLGGFRREAFDLVPEAQPYDLATLYQQLLARQELAAWESPVRFYEIGSLPGLQELDQLLSPPASAGLKGLS
ncbi:MAG: nucleotidyltransferase family protein [Acidobacteria bacterium]|nr:nucleotidyltransferase family protein [Acidobacteriota bacterium]